MSLLVGPEQGQLRLLQGGERDAMWLADAQILLQEIKNSTKIYLNIFDNFDILPS